MGRIRVGIGGWTYQPWRETFYPQGLAKKRELEYAASRLTTIEVNGTYYRSQTHATFARWRDETPEGFVFALKAPRFATNRRILAEAGTSIERFVASGLTELGDKLGPINWQFLPTKRFEAEDFAAFLALLPKSLDGRPLRHAVEVRHSSFRDARFVALAREHGVAIVVAGDSDSDHPQIADVTAPFVYLRIMGTVPDEASGYSPDALEAWAARAEAFARGRPPPDLDSLEEAPPDGHGRDLFLYVIGGHKAANPAAAMALIERLDRG